ncbi:MAG TPA: ABC transporter ATP-binding protein [Ilumatobacteraceae bacterium]|nr:ABC transporter ATP-binding protein [Ilumatobacteraceae bacterium]
MALIECRALTKCYDPRHPDAIALRSVDLDVDRGEMVAIMGPSGCGKSTLLHLIGGLDVPTSGTVTLDGQRFDDLTEARRAITRRSHVGYVFQFFNLISNLTVADNVELPMLLAGHSRREARTRREALLERLGVGDFASRPPSELSGGQQQRVAIARALANEPEVLLADEPTGNLDSEATGEVMEMLRDYHRAGQTIVLVTHDGRVGDAADRLLHMQDGAFLRSGQVQSPLPAAFTGG